MGEHRYAGQEGGVSMATHEIQLWLESSPVLLADASYRARQPDGAAELADWTRETLWPEGPDMVPPAERSTRDEIRDRIPLAEFDMIDWGFVRDSLLAE